MLGSRLGGDGVSVLTQAEVSGYAAPRAGRTYISAASSRNTWLGDRSWGQFMAALPCHSLEQMSAFFTAQRFAVPRLAVPLKVLEFGKSSDRDQ